MNAAKGLLSLIGTAVIAGWVAYAVSAPRNVENAMNEPMAQLDGSSINETIEQVHNETRSMHCERYRDLAQEAWDRSVENGTTERDQIKLDELDRQVQRFCN